MMFRFKAMDRLGLKLTAAAWVASLYVTGSAFAALSTVVGTHAAAAVSALPSAPRIQRSSVALPGDELAEIVRHLGVVHPAVKTEVLPNGNLRLAVTESSQYGQWRTAIADMSQLGSPDTVFETVSVCGASCSGAYFSAEFAVKRVAYAVGA